MNEASVLLVEDDRSLADIIGYNLRAEGYQVWLSHDGQDGIAQARFHQPDLVILDLMLPVVSGQDVCRQLRADSVTRKARILMLTAKAEEADQLTGFSLGADDYVTKPFSVKVLLERVKRLCRRNTDDGQQQIIVVHGLRIDPIQCQVTFDDQKLALTRSEFRLLESLALQPGRVFSRSELLDAVLEPGSIATERTIDVHIRAIRKKLKQHAPLIETVRGFGYRIPKPDPGSH